MRRVGDLKRDIVMRRHLENSLQTKTDRDERGRTKDFTRG